MAKDVTTFLSWASEPELDQRKKMGLQATIILTALTGTFPPSLLPSSPPSSLSVRRT